VVEVIVRETAGGSAGQPRPGPSVSAFHPLRQSGIDEELFDVIFGFEALNVEEK